MLRVTVTGCYRLRLIWILPRFWPIFRTRFFLLAQFTPRQPEEVLTLYPWSKLIICYKWNLMFNGSICSILPFRTWWLWIFVFMFFKAIINCNWHCRKTQNLAGVILYFTSLLRDPLFHCILASDLGCVDGSLIVIRPLSFRLCYLIFVFSILSSVDFHWI